jgi:hypothetical protein
MDYHLHHQYNPPSTATTTATTTSTGTASASVKTTTHPDITNTHTHTHPDTTKTNTHTHPDITNTHTTTHPDNTHTHTTTHPNTHTNATGPYDYLLYIDMDVVIMQLHHPLEGLLAAALRNDPQADFLLTGDWNGPNTGTWLAKAHRPAPHSTPHSTLYPGQHSGQQSGQHSGQHSNQPADHLARTHHHRRNNNIINHNNSENSSSTTNLGFTNWFLRTAWAQTQLLQKTDKSGKPHPFEYEQRAFHYLLGTPVWKKRGLPSYEGGKSEREIRSHFQIFPQCAFNSYSLHPLDFRGDRDVSQYTEGDFLIHFAGKKGLKKVYLMEHYLNIVEQTYSRAVLG